MGGNFPATYRDIVFENFNVSNLEFDNVRIGDQVIRGTLDWGTE